MCRGPEEKKSDILTQSEFIQFFRKLEESLKQEAAQTPTHGALHKCRSK